MAIIAHLSDKNILQLCGNDTKIMFVMVAQSGFGPGSGASFWIWSRLPAVNWDHFGATETGSFSLYIVGFPSPGIFLAMRYNV